MNTLNYIQFFDGLVEKNRGIFSMEKISTKVSRRSLDGQSLSYRCVFQTEDQLFSSAAISRKEALKQLYKKLKNFTLG